MSTLTRLKLGLTLIGLILFAYGARMDVASIRMVGIAFVAVAWVLRFVRRSGPPARGGEGSEGGGA